LQTTAEHALLELIYAELWENIRLVGWMNTLVKARAQPRTYFAERQGH
jgi:hypothetical protein